MVKLTRKQNIKLINHFMKQIIAENVKSFNKNNTDTHVHMDSDGILDFDKFPVFHGTGLIMDLKPSKSKYLKPDLDETKYFRRAFTYITRHTGALTLGVVCKINGFVAYGSKYPGRVSPVYILQTGMKYRPPLQTPALAKRVIKKYTHERCDSVHRAIHVALQLFRHQIFFDGNRRTAWVTCNYYLLQHHDGFLNIKPSQAKTWNKYRDKFYESGDMKPITNWLIKNCLYTKVADK